MFASRSASRLTLFQELTFSVKLARPDIVILWHSNLEE